jgi:hypothetical protein
MDEVRRGAVWPGLVGEVGTARENAREVGAQAGADCRAGGAQLVREIERLEGRAAGVEIGQERLDRHLG